ncbi:hypothetical protein SAMN05444673_2573 [Bacillus sp. OV166]|uniref:hypothetical protein n=1 Tax=Bacillus sp. OV166 TaxID=1882763 RepID=UPI000A2AAD26|nr:hypothetical protein [Bacillus sp. OV166]SMQ75932.1 hypothetical protein SAMN05444673_2573 [Bacillus sp. OV166]
MSDKVGGYAGPKPGGYRLEDPGTGGLRGYTGTKPGGDKAKAIVQGIKPGG